MAFVQIYHKSITIFPFFPNSAAFKPNKVILLCLIISSDFHIAIDCQAININSCFSSDFFNLKGFS